MLLLALPPGVFEAVVPWLILGTCLLVGAQPRISRWLKRAADAAPPDEHTRLSPATTFFSTLVGVYGGYFGAGSGVMMMAVLGFGSNLEFRILNALKTLAILASNLVASVIFVFVAELDWLAIVLLASGSIVGGYVGARIGRRLNPTVLRGLIVVVGVGGRRTDADVVNPQRVFGAQAHGVSSTGEADRCEVARRTRVERSAQGGGQASVDLNRTPAVP